MPSEFVVDTAHRVVYSRSYGVTTRADLVAAQADVRRQAGFDASFNVIVDLRDADLSQLSDTDIQTLASTTSFAESSRRALIADTDDKYGLARMYEIRREISGGGEAIRVCRTLVDAIDWLDLDVDPAVWPQRTGV